jgi:hypothetical protein
MFPQVVTSSTRVACGNYSDWPLWDKVFGTYRAPVEEPVQVGFERVGFAEQLKMLAFIDVNAAGFVNRGRIKVHRERAVCPREMEITFITSIGRYGS